MQALAYASPQVSQGVLRKLLLERRRVGGRAKGVTVSSASVSHDMASPHRAIPWVIPRATATRVRRTQTTPHTWHRMHLTPHHTHRTVCISTQLLSPCKAGPLIPGPQQRVRGTLKLRRQASHLLARSKHQAHGSRPVMRTHAVRVQKRVGCAQACHAEVGTAGCTEVVIKAM